MIDFISVNNEVFPLITAEDRVAAYEAMRDAGISMLPIWRANTDDVEDIGGVDGTGAASCSVMQTDRFLIAGRLPE